MFGESIIKQRCCKMVAVVVMAVIFFELVTKILCICVRVYIHI